MGDWGDFHDSRSHKQTVAQRGNTTWDDLVTVDKVLSIVTKMFAADNLGWCDYGKITLTLFSDVDSEGSRRKVRPG